MIKSDMPMKMLFRMECEHKHGMDDARSYACGGR